MLTSKKTSFYVSSVIKNYDCIIKNDRDEREDIPYITHIPRQPQLLNLLKWETIKGIHISDVQKFLEEEINKRKAFSKKYFRVARFVSNIDSVLIGITICAEGAGAVLLATGVAAPIALGLGISGAATGAI